jgi:hypothetical protein
MRWTLLAGMMLLALACSTSSSPAGSACTSAGGTCILGGSWCMTEAASGAQDCNPDRNPGGAYCCLAVEECTVADASLMDSTLSDAGQAFDSGDGGEAGDGGSCAVKSTVCADCVNVTGCAQEAVACAQDDAAPIPNCAYQYGLFVSCVCNVETSGTDALGSCEDEFAGETNGKLLTCITTICAGPCLGMGEP